MNPKDTYNERILFTMDKEFIYSRIANFQGSMPDSVLSERAGFNEHYISNMKNQSKLPSFDALEALCKVFRISMSTFFETLKDDISEEEKSFYSRLRTTIDPRDYALLCEAAEKAQTDDFHMLAQFIERHKK